jgi:4-hydroxythreonine-4-phosphate dehydrogenase
MPISRLNNKVIAVTSGDPAGIGPELILRSLSSIRQKGIKFLIIADKVVFDNVRNKLKGKIKHLCEYKTVYKNDLADLKEKINLYDLKVIDKKKYSLGKISKLCGKASAEYVLEAERLIKNNIAQALVTAPINKDAVNLAGYNWKGHTEVLAKLSGSKDFAMSFIARQFKIVLATTHLPLSKVNQELKSEDIYKKIILTNKYLKYYFKIKNPSIGVCGLNPHASDNGLFGDEEQKIIKPAVIRARKKKINVSGPDSAEKLFYDAYHKKIDALVAMYHDQALVPLKMILRDEAVNLTLGLPYIRTSCSSGTAYDIASKFIAREKTMTSAIKLAVKLSSLCKRMPDGRS